MAVRILRPLQRVMSSPTETPAAKVLEGIIAVHKPPGFTSADCIRKIQPKINHSKLFQPYLDRERQIRDNEPGQQRKSRKNKRIEVKIGHGGTLDPMASGVLVIGLGQGTKSLGGFLECTKEYVAEAIFGCSTDTYDRTGKRMHMAPYEHITREKVEAALEQFRGDILQKPPIYSALRINGKRYYEYAREGKELPVEIQARPVKCLELELLEFTTDHNYKYPKAVAGQEKLEMEELVKKAEDGSEEDKLKLAEYLKKKQEEEEVDKMPKGKRRKLNKMEFEKKKRENRLKDEGPAAATTPVVEEVEVLEEFPGPTPPVVKLRMNVGSGFYVRSLIHDLGIALGSAANMTSLARTRQGDYALGKNVVEWDDFVKEDGKWEEQVEKELTEWVDKNDAKKAAQVPSFQRRRNSGSNQAVVRTDEAPISRKRSASPMEKETEAE